MKKRILSNHSLQEGLLFLLLGGYLMYYGIDSRNHAFNKVWNQSPYLFPVIVAALLGLLAVSLMIQGVSEIRASQGGEAIAKPEKSGQPVTVLVVMGLSLAYYAALALIRLPYIGTSFGSFSLALSTFEVATLIFLFLLLFYLKVRSKAVLIAVPLITTVLISVLFRSVLHVLLP